MSWKSAIIEATKFLRFGPNLHVNRVASMTKTRVKFATKSQNLTLYDFSRCFTHENGSFKIHRAISAMRKQSLSVALFTSSRLGELCNDLVLSTEDYFELLCM